MTSERGRSFLYPVGEEQMVEGLRSLSWFGWSIETVAAMYETDSATRECEEGEVDINYVYAATLAEGAEHDKDSEIWWGS